MDLRSTFVNWEIGLLPFDDVTCKNRPQGFESIVCYGNPALPCQKLRKILKDFPVLREGGEYEINRDVINESEITRTNAERKTKRDYKNQLRICRRV